MDHDEIAHLGKALCEAAIQRVQIPCPAALHPSFSLQDAYAVQESLVSESLKRGRQLSGRKIGSALPSLWDAIGVSEPTYGCIFRDRTFRDRREMAFADLMEPRLEFEILFALKRDLDEPDIAAEGMLRATDYVAPAFELIEYRTLPDGRRINDIVADNHCFGACLIGGLKMRPAFAEIGAQSVEIHKNGEKIHVGRFQDVMGNPVNSLLWLAKRMIEKNSPLRAGDLILSGSVVPPIPIAQGDAFTAQYTTFGENAIRFE